MLTTTMILYNQFNQAVKLPFSSYLCYDSIFFAIKTLYSVSEAFAQVCIIRMAERCAGH